MKILKFYADWCQPCKVLSPLLEECCEQNEIEIKAIDVDDDEAVNDRYNVRGVPTVIAVDDDGKEIDRFSGVKDRSFVLNFLNEVI